jgi:hypothetical protein
VQRPWCDEREERGLTWREGRELGEHGTSTRVSLWSSRRPAGSTHELGEEVEGRGQAKMARLNDFESEGASEKIKLRLASSTHVECNELARSHMDDGGRADSRRMGVPSKVIGPQERRPSSDDASQSSFQHPQRPLDAQTHRHYHTVVLSAFHSLQLLHSKFPPWLSTPPCSPLQ